MNNINKEQNGIISNNPVIGNINSESYNNEQKVNGLKR